MAGELAQWGVAQMTTDVPLRALDHLAWCVFCLHPGTWVEETGPLGLAEWASCGFREILWLQCD